MCSNPATSREHIPPLCLFPESKDVQGLDLRKGLITVPSCDAHNSEKSQDDEFLMMSLAGIISNNFIGLIHSNTKVKRALIKKGKEYLKSVIRNPKIALIRTHEEKEFAIIFGNPDFKRLLKCFEHIAYGLFYNEFSDSFNGKIRMILGFINYTDPYMQTLVKFMQNRFDLEELALEIKGKNPDVFTYQFCDPDKFGLIGLKLTFYRSSEVYISFHPEGTKEPFDLGIEFMRSGIPTIIKLDGKEYRFNFDKSQKTKNRSNRIL